jgi:cysteine desulfuration protein SufE
MSSLIDDLIEDFEFLEEWEDRYRYVIELGRELAPFPEEQRNDQTKVKGCVSQVWLIHDVSTDDPPKITFIGDSDAHIVRGLIAILIRLYSGKTAQEILKIDAPSLLGQLGLDTHLTPQRSNGLFAMVKRIQSDAESVIAARTASE